MVIIIILKLTSQTCEEKVRFFAIVELHSRPPANSDGGKIGGSKLRTSILSTVVATLLTVCASPAAFATEYSPKAEEILTQF